MKKVVKKEKILMDVDKIPNLIEKFGCGRSTVYNALAFRCNSKQAAEIRSYALDFCGAEKVKESRMIRQ